MALKCIVFDLGDTLVNQKEALKNFDKDIALPFFKNFGFKGTLLDIAKAKKDMEETIEKIRDSHGDRTQCPIMLGRALGIKIKRKEAEDYLKKRNSYRLQNINLFDNALDTLNFIKKRNIKMILLSDGWKDTVYSFLDKFNLRNFFDHIFISEDLGARKKNGLPFDILLKYTSLKPSEILMVGDSLERDGKSIDAGTWFCFFDAEDKDICEGFDFKIKNLLEIKNIIEFFENDIEFNCYLCGDKKSKLKNKLFCNNCAKKAKEYILSFTNKNGIKDLLLYKKDEGNILKKVIQGPILVRNDWILNFPKTEIEIKEFYKNNFNYIFDLTLCHSSPFHIKESNFAVAEASRHGGKILDFGAGIGNLTIELAEKGFDITHSDLDGALMNYVKWRNKQRKLNIKFLSLDKELEGNYDVIICLDVVEHLLDPIHTLRMFFDHINTNGILIINERFQNIKDMDKLHPMHLLQNFKFKGKFKEIILSIRFRLEKEYKSPKKGRAVYVFRKALK